MKVKAEHPEDDVIEQRYNLGLGRTKTHNNRSRSFGAPLTWNRDPRDQSREVSNFAQILTGDLVEPQSTSGAMASLQAL